MKQRRSGNKRPEEDLFPDLFPLTLTPLLPLPVCPSRRVKNYWQRTRTSFGVTSGSFTFNPTGPRDP
eukprot:5284392-Heterocapsa_arctica.AAC.1